VQLTAADTAELAAFVPLGIELEPYRERLTPLALAVLEGARRRTIEKRRELVLADVWDAPLREAVLAGMATLRAELERKRLVLDLAEADLGLPARKSRLARRVVDRVLAELLDDNDKNLDALLALERSLEALPPDDRASRAAVAARGAYIAARIPPNELRAAIVRVGRAANAHGLDEEDVFEHTAVLMARSLATDERRAAVREWTRMLAEGSTDHVPLLAEELQALAVESASVEAGSDLIWTQACVGLTMEVGLALS
jgi:hypothetical protein